MTPSLPPPGSRAAGRTRRRLAGLPLLAALALACDDAVAPVPGVVLSVVIDSAAGPIARTAIVRLDRPAPVALTYGAPGTPVLTVGADSAAAEHRLLLPRLRAARRYTLEAGVPDGASPPLAGAFDTGALPPELAEIELTVAGRPSVPVALVEVVGAPRFSGLLVVEDGEIVGYIRVNGSLFGMTRRANGNVVLLEPDLGLVERRLDGTLVHRLPQPDGEAGASYGRIHHDVTATPGNTILFIANETRPVDGEAVVGEALWEWTPGTGAVRRRWSAFDHLDWRTERGPRSNAGNWLHGNGISYGPRGNVIMSLRNADQVISIAPDFSRVEWALGGVNGTLAVSDEDRFYGQHHASEPAPGHVLVFDNGFGRPGGAYSRAIEYRVDATAGRATRVWQYRHAPEIYAALVGSALRLPNGNTTALFGMTPGESGSRGPLTAVEVTPAGAVAWRLTVGPQLTRLYRLTPVASLVGERAGAFGGG